MKEALPNPTVPKVRLLLRERLRDASDFDAFCHDHFPDVHGRFSDNMNRVARETLLLLHADPTTVHAKLTAQHLDTGAPSLSPNNLPPRNANFVGREEALASLHRQLGASSPALIIPSAVFGLGGLGKSSLALEYAYRHAADYSGGLWWVRAEGGPVEALLALATDLRASGPPSVRDVFARVAADAPSAEVARWVTMALQNHGLPTLLILDNVASAEWRAYLPGGAVRVLATTRDRTLLPTAQALPLAVLSDGEACELAERLGGTVTDAGEIAARGRVLRAALGNLPVAVEVAARAVAQWHLSWSDYERLLEAQPVEVLDDESVRGSYARGVFAALDLSIDRLGDGTPAQRLLEGAAVFAPDDIPREWAMAAADLGEGLDAHRAVATLEALGLLTVEASGSRLSLHRLVRRWVRTRAERGSVAETTRIPDAGASNRGWVGTCRRGIACVRAWMAATVDSGRIAVVDARRAHLDEVLSLAESVDPKAWSAIADRLATHLWHRAQNREARALFERVLQVDEAALGKDHITVATRLSNLALVLKDLGDALGARPLLERALRSHEVALGPEHEIVATDLLNLALVLDALGDAAGARPLLERALCIHEIALSPEDPLVATGLSNLAAVLKGLGDAAGARLLLERALRIYEAALGPDHPLVATALSNLGTVLNALGDAVGARPLLERALRSHEIALGPDHPLVATALSNLALVLKNLGDAVGARLLLERALRIHEGALGPDHPLVATALSNLAMVLEDLGDAAGARPRMERALRIDEAVLGLEHPEVATDLSNLATVLQALGDAAGARPLLERALRIGEAALGPEHPSVATRLSNLATVLQDLGDVAGARPLLERALALNEVALGPEHPSVATCLSNLALVLRALGDAAGARPLLERALRLNEAALGPEHPSVATSLSNLALVLHAQGDVAGARLLLERALAILESRLGRDHPRTQTLRRNLATLPASPVESP